MERLDWIGMPARTVLSLLALAGLVIAGALPVRAIQGGTTYYVANDGDDGNDGLTPDTAIATIAAVNALDLRTGDKVLFACGDTWHAEMLEVTESGAEGQPIVLGPYPEGCADQPMLSGALSISGWTRYSNEIVVADLAAGKNAAKFVHGVNQLFLGDQRLPNGRWPNLDEGDAGYSTIDAYPAPDQIVDNELPVGDWTGAAAHVKGIRWYILNRAVTEDTGQTLTMGTDLECLNGCTGWGYFLNNHLNALDREGEWAYDAGTQRVYLYTTGPVPADGQVEGSVVLVDDGRSWGGVTLGQDHGAPVSYVVVENLALSRWFEHGIAAPTNMSHDENHHLVLHNNTITDVDGAGIYLKTWLWQPSDGGASGWRGGYDVTVSGNRVERANHMGINSYGRDSTFSDNVIRDVGLIENLGPEGMGCGYDMSVGCAQDGDGLRITSDLADYSGNGNLVVGNQIKRVGYCGIDIFGPYNTIRNNTVEQACYSKGDCGGVRTFGSDDLSTTRLHDVVFDHNIILDTIGNTDGCAAEYKPLFGFGMYIDNYSRDVTVTGNTVVSSTAHGILYQNSTGVVMDNVAYNNGRMRPVGCQLRVLEAPAAVYHSSGNVLYGLTETATTLFVYDLGRLEASDNNYYFQPYVDRLITVGGPSGTRTLEEWQTYSGLDANSTKNWFTLEVGETPRSHLFYNPTGSPLQVDLGSSTYFDLDQNVVADSVTLPPYSSVVLIDSDASPFTLVGMLPAFWRAADARDLTLTLRGSGFTPSSVVRWNGADRPTVYVSDSALTATIYAQDVSATGAFAVTVYDPVPVPMGKETAPLTFRVVEEIYRMYLPALFK